MTYLKNCIFLLTAFVAIASAHAASSSAKFLLPNTFSEVTLAPDGKHVAMVERPVGGGTVLKIADTSDFKVDVTHVTDGKAGQADVLQLQWLGNDRLVMTSSLEGGNGLYVFQLGEQFPKRWAKEGSRSLVRTIPGTTRFFVMERSADSDPELSRLIEYDAQQGEGSGKLIYEADTRSLEVVVDSKGRLRAVKKGTGNGDEFAWYRLDQAGEAIRLSSLEPWSRVYGIHGASSQLVATGGSGSSLLVYDIEADKKAQTLTEHPMYSLVDYGEVAFHGATGRIAGFHLNGFEPQSFWLDPEYQKNQKQVDEILAGSRNRIVGLSEDGDRVLVQRTFGMLPSQVCLVRHSSKSVNVVVHGGGKVSPEEVGTSKLVNIPNREGVILPVVVTTPAGFKGGSAPVVVWIRPEVWGGLERLDWSPEANYFAAAGYMVVRVNYRGSRGLGGDLAANAQTKEGVSMMFSDIEDVVQAFVAAGVADPQRIAIGGEAAGAWAASYAAKVSPGRYRAILCLNGVYDLDAALDEESAYDATAGVNLGFATRWSGMPREDILAFQTIDGGDAYPKFAFVCYGKWSPSENVDQASRFAKALKKSGTSVKTHTGDWYGSSLSGAQRFEAFEKASSVLKAAFK